MNVRLYSQLLVLTALFVASSPVSRSAQGAAQDSIVFRPEVERQFVEAMRLFQAGRYDSAAVLFAKNVREYPRTHRSTGSSIMGAKAWYMTGNYKESVKLLKDLLDLYPESNYVPDAHYTLGLNFFKMSRFEDAAAELLTVRQTAHDPKLVSRSERLLDLLCSSNLSLAELQLLLADANIDLTRALIGLRMAEKIYQSGDIKASTDLLRTIGALPPNVKYVGDALTLLEGIQKGGVLKIGVVLPLMLRSEKPAAREVGIEFLDGIQFAADEFNRDAAIKVALEIRDSERDPSVSARQVTELCNDDKVVAILGPVSSGEVFASAGVSNMKGVPLITPTGTSNGIAAIGGYIFQANPDYDVRGRAMAQYAFDKLAERRFGVLAPVDAPGKLIAEAFIDQVKKLGGELVDVQWYQSGATDLRLQLATMRQRALEKSEVPFIDFSAKLKKTNIDKMLIWGVNPQVVDSLSEHEDSAFVTFLFGPNGARIADSLAIPTGLVKLKYDSLGLPVHNVDGLFVPIASSDEIPVVSSQIKFYNFQSQLLGTGEWNDASELDQNQQYTNGVIFAVDSYVDSKDQSYRAFVSAFQKVNKKKTPGVNTLFGYDAAKLLLQVIGKGATHRNEIAAELPKIKGFSGHHSKISFTSSRVNTYLVMMQYKNHTMRKIGEIDLSQTVLSPPGN